jgi:hypothetical protein
MSFVSNGILDWMSYGDEKVLIGLNPFTAKLPVVYPVTLTRTIMVFAINFVLFNLVIVNL